MLHLLKNKPALLDLQVKVNQYGTFGKLVYGDS